MLYNPLEGVFHQKRTLQQKKFHGYGNIHLGYTSDLTCIDIQLQRNIKIQGHTVCDIFLHYTMAHIYTNEKCFHQQKTQFST